MAKPDFVLGVDFLNQLCDALGIADQGVSRLVIVADCDDVARVYVKTMLPGSKAADVARVLAIPGRSGFKVSACRSVEVADDCTATVDGKPAPGD